MIIWVQYIDSINTNEYTVRPLRWIITAIMYMLTPEIFKVFSKMIEQWLFWVVKDSHNVHYPYWKYRQLRWFSILNEIWQVALLVRDIFVCFLWRLVFFLGWLSGTIVELIVADIVTMNNNSVPLVVEDLELQVTQVEVIMVSPSEIGDNSWTLQPCN